jgi:hypothetical protein
VVSQATIAAISGLIPERNVVLRSHGFFHHPRHCCNSERVRSYRYSDCGSGGKRAAPLAGDFAFLLFALGILGVGVIGVPVLAGSAALPSPKPWTGNRALNKKRKMRADS